MANGKVGAPGGYHDHWLDDELNGLFTRSYKLQVNKHNYRYARYKKRTLIDEFLVVRTSKRCYRVIYFNADYNYFYYFSATNYRFCAQKMKGIFNMITFIERCREEKKT